MKSMDSHYYTLNLLILAIREHSYYEKVIKDCNYFFRCITFIMYYITTPGFLIALYGSHHRDTNLILRIFFAFIVIICFSATIGMNIMSTWITNAAHKSLPLLYGYQRKYPKIPVKYKLKIHAFIERLS